MASDRIVILNDDNFDEQVQQRSLPILVDFWASWCAPCKAVSAALGKIAEELAGRAVVASVDVDDNGDLMNRFGILSVPTLLVLREGKVVDRLVGAAPEGAIRALLQRHLD